MLWAVGLNPLYIKHVSYAGHSPRVKSGIACTQTLQESYTPFVIKGDKMDAVIYNSCGISAIFYDHVHDIREYKGRLYVLVDTEFPESKLELLSPFFGDRYKDEDPYIHLADLFSDELTQLNVQHYTEVDGKGITTTTRYERLNEMYEDTIDATEVFLDKGDLGRFGCLCFTFTSKIEQEVISDGIEPDVIYRIYNKLDLTEGEEVDLFSTVMTIANELKQGITTKYDECVSIVKAANAMLAVKVKRGKKRKRR